MYVFGIKYIFLYINILIVSLKTQTLIKHKLCIQFLLEGIENTFAPDVGSFGDESERSGHAAPEHHIEEQRGEQQARVGRGTV